MESIELPTYKTIVPNEVFVKNGKMIGEVFSKQALIIERYRVPTKEDVMKTIIEEVLSREKVSGRIAVVVLDVHGEYSSFAEPAAKSGQKNFSGKTTIIKSDDIKIGVSKLNVGLISSIVSGLSSTQKRELEKILNSLKNEMRGGAGPFGLEQVEAAISSDKEISKDTSRILLSWVASLKELRLFGKTDIPSVFDIVRSGHLTVFDLSDEINLKKKQIIVSYFANKLFFERKSQNIPPFLLVVEESHQFIPEKTREEAAISKRILETIAREGRKFGACLCLVSQRPVNLSTTALANCNTHLILRVTNPYDLDHIGESSEGLDRDSQKIISGLAVGEALLVGEAVNFPLFFKVRKNLSPDSKHEISLEDAAKNFESKKEGEIKEAQEFL